MFTDVLEKEIVSIVDVGEEFEVENLQNMDKHLTIYTGKLVKTAFHEVTAKQSHISHILIYFYNSSISERK
jgi:hypothetical protein